MVKSAATLARGGLRRLRRRSKAQPAAASRPAAPVAMDPPEKLHEFWRQSSPAGNDPRNFIAPVGRSKALVELLNFVGKDARILEVGSGVGRNLAALVDAGFKNVEGVEISPHAVKLMRKTYSQLAGVTVHEGAAEEVLPGLKTDGYDVVVTMATLAHIHPDNSSVFDDIIRIGRQVLVIEGPGAKTHRQFPHDYDTIFGAMHKQWERPLSGIQGIDKGVASFTARRFMRMDQQATLHEFWRQPAPQGNNPHDYIRATGRSQALLELISDLPKDAHILEVGCNVGRNVAWLFDHGYTNIQGIEINSHAVELLRKTYPQLADVQVSIGAAGEVLPKFADDEFDLVYTMAVLEHIHPDESSVFDDMTRIGKQILAIEPPGSKSHRQFPHDIPKVFGDRGMKLVSKRNMGEFESNAGEETIKRFDAYRFHRDAD